MITFLWTCIAIWQYYKYSSFVEVEAKIINSYTKTGCFPNTLSDSHFVTYEYKLDDNIYTSTRQLFAKKDREVGKVETVRCNPNNPEEIEDMYSKRSSSCIAIYLAIYSAILGAGLLRKNS